MAKEYEYRVDSAPLGNLHAALNEYGSQGWRVVHIYTLEPSANMRTETLFVMEREKEST